MKQILITFIVLLVAILGVSAKEKDCEVCIGVLTKFADKAKADNISKIEDLEDMYRAECKKFEHPREKRLCWYLGASPDSATNIIREVSRPLSIGVPPSSVCKRIRKKDSAICGLRYEGSSVNEPVSTPKPKKKPAIPWAKLKTLRVKQLKKYLSEFGVTCTDCVEKGDYINELLKHKPKEEL